MTSNAPGSGTSISSSWKASIGLALALLADDPCGHRRRAARPARCRRWRLELRSTATGVQVPSLASRSERPRTRSRWPAAALRLEELVLRALARRRRRRSAAASMPRRRRRRGRCPRSRSAFSDAVSPGLIGPVLCSMPGALPPISSVSSVISCARVGLVGDDEVDRAGAELAAGETETRSSVDRGADDDRRRRARLVRVVVLARRSRRASAADSAATAASALARCQAVHPSPRGPGGPDPARNPNRPAVGGATAAPPAARRSVSWSASQASCSARSYSAPSRPAQALGVVGPRATRLVLERACDGRHGRSVLLRADCNRAVQCRPARAYNAGDGPARRAARDRRVPRRRHRDERQGRRRVRADRGRRGARRRRRAARPLGDARRRARAAVARHPALHRHHAGDGRRGARRRARAARPGRAAARPRARRAQRVVRPARAAPGVRARRARVARPAGAVHGRAGAAVRAARAPAQARRARRARWASRSRSRTARSPTPRRARACSARCSRGCARTRRRSATRSSALRPDAAAQRRGPKLPRAPRDARPARLRRPARHARRLHLPQRRGPAALRRQVGARCARARGRTSRRRADGGDWTAQASIVDHRATRSELGALLLENRLIKALRPPGNVKLKHSDRYVYLRCRFDIAVPGARGRARARRGPRGERRAAARARRRRSSSRSSSTRCSGCATAGASCRAATTRRSTGRWGAACRRASATSTRTSTAARLDEALALFTGARRRRRGAARARRARRCARPRPSSASSAPRGCAAATRACASCSSGSGRSCARRTRTRGSCVAEGPEGADAFWLVGGRVVDWGPVGAADDVVERTEAALRRARRAVRPARRGRTSCASSRRGSRRTSGTRSSSSRARPRRR